MKKIFLIVFIAGSLYNCATPKQVTKHESLQEPIKAAEIVVEKNLGKELNGSWELQSLWGTNDKWPTAPNMNIEFDKKTFTGNTGCNTISGKFTANGNYITIDKEIASTKLACPGGIEKSFLSILLKINKFVVNNTELELSQEDIVLMKFKRK